MSLLRSVGRSIKEDTKNVAMVPVEFAREIRYTIHAIQEGKISPTKPLKTAGITIGATIVVLALLFPLYWILISALSGSGGSIYSTGGLSLFPKNPTMRNFVWVIGDLILPAYAISFNIPLTNAAIVVNTPSVTFLDASTYGIENPSGFKQFFVNSMTVAVPTVLIAMSLIVPGAYALSRREFIGRNKILFGYVLLTQVGGGLGIALLIGLYTVFVQLGVNNSKLALSVYYAATAVPFNTWLLKTYMDGIPVSYEEAAIVDGAPPWRVVTEIILPLSKAGLATVFIFTFLTGWTEFIVAQTLLGTENYTLPVGLYSIIGEYSIPWARFSSFALLFATPLGLVYLFAQRYIEGGLSFGGVEG
ncbi:sugar ABC transporter permease [Haloarchaeobius sp. HME9146]|uniref:sugar ABC transporter permease n=1 Tax=Haloarchaeobius sp. HME9146 TaxID=2978732 RepID=UPI0021C1C5C6|nr:ABC transporter permease subunit [Haloarchaeobius sp. HME9146]MCT9095447.1 ABC transporter permease subunit [Haloarchaeobius sp. HME9146]